MLKNIDTSNQQFMSSLKYFWGLQDGGAHSLKITELVFPPVIVVFDLLLSFLVHLLHTLIK